jgi:S-ribosylhomocysteine lyase
MKDVLGVKEQKDIPELNIYQCGTYKMHSLEDAKEIASKVLERHIGVMDNDALTLDESMIG